ncbi:MAG TPA: glycosyltransferase family 1 protein [Opitutaceae bacterium]
MKIALVTETYPPEVNGVAMTLSRLVQGLRTRGHRVEVVRPRQATELHAREKPLTEDLLVPGVPIPFYKALRLGLPVTGRLRRRWATRRPDVVHVATEGPLGLAAVRAARALRLPVTSSFHTNFHAYGGHYGFKPLRGAALGYLRWFHNRTRCTLVPAGDLRAALESDGFERLGVLARGVDAQLFAPGRRRPELRASWGASADTPVVIYVGRMAAEKNLGLAVEAFLAMQQEAPRAKFVLVGDGPERPALARQYPQFHYAGMRRGEDLAAHYASADVFVFPSVTETFGNVVTEALASGLVVLAYDYAAAREHVRSGENGFTVPFGDGGRFLAAAQEIMQRRSEWPALRAAARASALAITWDAIIEKFEGELRMAAG